MEKKIKVVGISDIHGSLPDIPKCDVVCCAGDISPLEIQNNQTSMVSWFCLEFLPWVKKLPCKKFILVAGNHDFFLQNIHKVLIDWSKDGYTRYTWIGANDVMENLLPGDLMKTYDKLVYLCDSSYEYKGHTFYGSPWIRDLKRWAFYLDNDSLKEKFNKIPEKCDVIITHMPPKIEGLGGVLQGGCYNTGADYGSPELAEVLKTRNFKYALCGHVHSGQHNPVEIGDKKLVNVSFKNEQYQETYYPFEFEI